MNRKFIIGATMLVLLLSFNPSVIGSSSVEVDQTTKLTIYTYDTLLADPGYNYTEEFIEYAGLENGSVEVKLLSDAGSILTTAVAEKNDPVADVLIGLDNVLVSEARDQDILTPYQPNGSEALKPELVDALASDYLLTPYDHGYFSLWYLENRLNQTIPDDFTLNDILDSDLDEKLIVENPNLSTPGLGFFLSTIAIMGDEESGVEGVIDGDWEEFWRQMSVDTRLTSSWGDAIDLLYQEEVGRPMMASYTTSPAYGNCLWGDNSTEALLTHEDGKQWAWEQVEGIGLVKNAKNPELAKEFIDWFISKQVQSEIHQNQWMYPARNDIEDPACFSEAIDPNTITSLNGRIPRDVLDQHLDSWLDTWEVAWAEGPSGFLADIVPFSPFYLLGFLALIPISYKRKH